MKFTQLFTKTLRETPKDADNISTALLLRGGFIDKLASGIYSFLPLGWRVLSKIENIIREEMDRVGGQEILMPALHPKENWEITGRWKTDVMFKMKSQTDHEYGLGWTHEEIATPLAKKFISSYKDLPRAVYHIQTKFRDEVRAKSGLLRTREFSMKDLYSFHASQEDLDQYYDKMKEAYFEIYDRVGIRGQTVLTYSSGGAFSKYSHEFQTITDAGEDEIYVCKKCKTAINREIIDDQKVCPQCGSGDFDIQKAIEVGNIFKLGNRFSSAFDFKFLDEKNERHDVIMGCYGLGPSRTMGAIVEINHDDKGIIWPESIAPYKIHLLNLGADDKIRSETEKIYNDLAAAGIEVLFDDRDESAGIKFADADLIGCPLRITVSQKTLAQDSVEIKKRSSKDSELVKIDKLSDYLTD